jgi:hypothetical protein
MLDSPTVASRVGTPGVVIAAMVVLSGAAGLGVVVGIMAGLMIISPPDATGPDSAWVWVEVPQYTIVVLWACLWLNLAWFLVRTVVAFAVVHGSRAARVAAISAEAMAFPVLIAMLFLSVEGRHKLDADPFLMLRVGSGICILLSAAVILLLCKPSAKAWCGRR